MNEKDDRWQEMNSLTQTEYETQIMALLDNIKTSANKILEQKKIPLRNKIMLNSIKNLLQTTDSQLQTLAELNIRNGVIPASDYKN